MKKIDKEVIHKKSDEELRGWIIQSTNRIEASINPIITNYFQPKDKKLFQEIILNSSIMHIGSKYKVIGNIHPFESNKISQLRKLFAIRNYFAHADILHPVILKITQGESTEHIDIPRSIRYMNSQGIYTHASTEELLDNFISHYEELMLYFDNHPLLELSN